MDKRKLLRAVYESIEWSKLYERMPEATRRQVDALFGELRGMLGEPPEPEVELPDGLPGEEVMLYCDGASRGNPGPAGIGMVLTTVEGAELLARGAPLGRTTNNVAEYRALIEGLKAALELGAQRVRVCSDSELLVRQIEGTYRVKSPKLKPLHAEAVGLLADFEGWTVRHIPREQNARADALATRAARRKT